MTVKSITIGEPFFTIEYLSAEENFCLEERAILLNLGKKNIKIKHQKLKPLESVIVQNTEILGIETAIIIKNFDQYNEADVFKRITNMWPTAYEVRGEERLKGVSHFMSPKIWEGRFGFTLYLSQSVPLNVGLHKEHPFCPEPGFREVHTQIMGIGKMQQCQKKDISTLYLEEIMAPGSTHKPMYDKQGNYPWHQYETITPSIFMAVEILPEPNE